MSVDDEQRRGSSDWAITRRDALRGALAGGMLVTAGGVLAACGSEDVDVPTSDFGATSLKGVRDGGTLRIGVAGGGADDSIDAHVPATVPDISRVFQLYEPLAGRDTELGVRARARRVDRAREGRGDVDDPAAGRASPSTTASR